MDADADPVDGRRCGEWRTAYRGGASPYLLATRDDCDRATVLSHLQGDCTHDVSDPPISGGRTHKVDADECRHLRDSYANEVTIEALQDSTGRGWKTLVRHLTGDCTHDTTGAVPTWDKSDVLRRDSVTASDCAGFRRDVRDASDVASYAETVDFDYQVILAHVNGECAHDVDEPVRTPNARARNISQDLCLAIRDEYRSNPDVDVGSLAAEHDVSATTVERHVSFQCSHGPADTLVTDVDAVQDILDEGVRTAGERQSPNVEDENG